MQQWNWVNSDKLLRQATCDYIQANHADLEDIISSGISEVHCHFTDKQTEQGWSLNDKTLNVNLLPETARRLQANSWAFRWSSGVLTTPTLIGLVRTGIIDRIADTDTGESIGVIGKSLNRTGSDKTLGNIWGGLHLLELQGWAKRTGRDSETVFYLTRLGRAVIQLVRDHWETFLRLTDDIAAIRNYHALCHNMHTDTDAVSRFKAFISASNDNWGLPVDSIMHDERLASRQLAHCLDGLLMGSAMVAMGMPVYERQGIRIIQIDNAVLAYFLGHERWIDWSEIKQEINREFVDAAFDWLAMRHLAERNGEALRLTPQGQMQLAITPPLAALGVSYLKSYEYIDDLLVGSGDPCGIDNDTHVDRVMNVYGSSGAGSGPASVTINEKIINHYFNELPLEQQPAGIADIGCGDGTSLKRLAEHVINHTRRGKELADYPLVVIGADYNDAPLELTRETLSAFDTVEGVTTLVVKADISNPDAYNASLGASGVTVKDFPTGSMRPLRLDDVLHTYMFLIHNRRLCVQTPAEAEAIIGKAFASVDKTRLRDAFLTYFGYPLPENNDDALKMVLESFDMSFSGSNGLVPGIVAAADLLDFMLRWKPYAKHGLISLEGHSPSRYEHEEQIGASTQFLRADKLPHPLNWGMHFQSRQFMMPFNQYMLAMVLAGFRPHDNHIYGGINPPAVPSIDQSPQHRFFSIGCYVPEG